MKNLYLHICCAPCSAWSVPALRKEGLQVRGCFFNPNIHPFSEYLRRSEALSIYQSDLGIEVDYAQDYRPEEYFTAVIDSLDERCRHCYELRLRFTARQARRRKCDAFSTTLLFSIYQKHDLLREVGERIGEEEGVAFLYRDLRPGWEEGGRSYRETGLYRQNYCGCIFSEKERIEHKRMAKEGK
jgi:predicted adenine nucleotide alpha hydrolase (AANH) superfamily ATPase